MEQVARLFGVPRKALRDHLERHLLPVVEYSGALSRVAVGLRGIKETVGRLNHLAELGEKALQLAVEELGTIGENGKRGGSVKDVATMLDSLRQTIELRGRLRGELGNGGGVDGTGGGNSGGGNGKVGNGDTVVRVGPRMAVMMVPSLSAQEEVREVQGAEREVPAMCPSAIATLAKSPNSRSMTSKRNSTSRTSSAAINSSPFWWRSNLSNSLALSWRRVQAAWSMASPRTPPPFCSNWPYCWSVWSKKSPILAGR